MSRTDRRVDKGVNCSQLPITNILNNLTFSDDEDLGFNFDEDLSLDSASDDSDYVGAPPGDYTGGKWKPGEKPLAYKKHRHRYRGKWPPGEGPGQSTVVKKKTPVSRGKNIKLIPGHEGKSSKKSKKSKTSSNKIFECNFCHVTFNNRFKYSNHCSGRQHKENVFGYGESDLKQTEKLAQNDIDTVNESNDINELDDDIGLISETTEDVPKLVPEIENKDEPKNAEYDEESLDGYDTEEYYNEGDTVDKKECSDEVIDTPLDDGANSTDPVQVLVQVHVCTICDKKFQNKYFLARHLLTKFHRNRALSQKEEDAVLVKKYQKCIIRLSPYQCSICRYYYTKNEEFHTHLHSEEHCENCKNLVGEMQCTLCRYKSHSLEAILEHIAADEHLAKIGKHNRICVVKECHASCTCKYCGIETYSYTRLQQHIKKKHADRKIVHGVKKRQVGVRNRPKCEQCGLQLSSPSALSLHTRRQHSDQRVFYCKTCKTGFSDKYAFSSHCKSAAHTRKVSESSDAKNVDEKLKELDEKTGEFTVDGDDIDKSIDADDETTGDKLEQTDDLSNDEQGILDMEEDWKVEDGGLTVSASGRKKSRSGLPRTVRTSRKNKQFKCNHCDFSVTNYDDLRPHYMSEHSGVIKLCELCDVIFLSEKAYKLHVLSKDHQANINASGNSAKDDTQYFQCHVCKKKFTDEKYCKFHTAYQHFHLTTEDAVLKESGYKSITREKYADFLQSVTSRGWTDVLNCPDCGTSIKKNNLMVHLRTHTDERPFSCRICPKKFRSNYNLRKHLLGHFGCLERHCNVCGKDFSKPSNFEEHMALHVMEKSNVEKSHVCDFCGQSFFLARQLSVHKRRHRKKDLKCDVPGCHWTFAFNHELKTHKMTHSEERPFLCDTCGFAAYSPYHLKRHNRIHSSEKRFHCEYCTYKAGNKTHLRRHMRIHIGSKPFKCPYCSFACNTHENIRKHILETKKHDGLKVYPCKFCQFATNSSKDFRGHLMSDHPKETDDGARHVPLSVFTGLFHKDEDLERPAEGTQVLPCKERKLTGKKQVGVGDDEHSAHGKVGNMHGDKPDKKHSRKRKVETDNGMAQDLVINKHMRNDLPPPPQHTYQHEPINNEDLSLSHPNYPLALISNKSSSTVPSLQNTSFQHYPNVPGSHPSLGMTDLVQNMGVPGRMQPYNNIPLYQDYSTKYDVTRNSNNTDTNNPLNMDMNYAHQH
ncbi:hypothetical protein ACF0H5_006701 [Mactra antiquata]